MTSLLLSLASTLWRAAAAAGGRSELSIRPSVEAPHRTGQAWLQPSRDRRQPRSGPPRSRSTDVHPSTAAAAVGDVDTMSNIHLNVAAAQHLSMQNEDEAYLGQGRYTYNE